MKYFVDGDQLVITKDDFVDFQESPALFYPLESEIAKAVLEAGRIIALPVGDLMRIHDLLEMGCTKETRRKISEAMKGKQNSLGHKPSEETKRKISESQRRRYVKKRKED